MKDEIYYPIDKQTKEVLAPVEAEYRGGMYHIPRDALQSEHLPPKQGLAVVAVLDDSGRAVDSEYIEDHRGKTIYDESDCTKSEIVSELGPIKAGFTPEKPSTIFDERIDSKWVTNKSNKYIADYDAVDNIRRSLYREISDPLYMESYRKKENGQLEEAAIFKAQADAAVEKIQAEHPFPIAPVI